MTRFRQLQERILQAATRVASAQEIAQEICRLAEGMLSDSVATVLLLDEEGVLQPFAAPGVPPEAVQRLRGIRPGPESGSCGNAVLREEPVYVCDTLHDQRWRGLLDVAQDFGILSCWSTPIRDGFGKVIGSFALSGFANREPGDWEILILDAAVNAVGLVLQRSQIEKQRDLQAQALAAIAEGVLLTDAKQDTIWCNSSFEQITGYSLAEILGKNCRLLQGPETNPKIKQAIAQALRAGESYSGEILNYRKDGTPIWIYITINPLRDEKGLITNYIGVQRDITKRKLIEKDLHLAAASFEVDEGILIVDRNQKIERVNNAFCRITGYTAEEAIGKNPSFLHSGRQDQNFYESMWQSILEHGSWSGEIWNRRKNGEVYPEQFTITAVLDKEGNLQHYVGFFEDISERKAQEERLQDLAQFDILTKLPNRTLFEKEVETALRRPDTVTNHNQDSSFAIGLLDLDGFKEINDTLGHDAGDRLLQLLGKHLQSGTRSDEVIARLGGDEFGFMIWFSSQEEIQGYSRRLLTEIRRFSQEVNDIQVSGSLGWAIYSQDGSTYHELLAHADEAMYAAKAAGKDTFLFYHGKVQQQAERRIWVHRSLPLAITSGDIDFFLQPQVDLSTGKLDGAELLVRWRQRNGRWQFPGKFIADVESDTHLVRSLGIYSLIRASEMRSFLTKSGASIPLSLNIGAKHFLHQSFLEDIQEFCPDGSGLKIEITESALLHDLGQAREISLRLKERGFHLCMDDFGTGYSSLQYLVELPFDEIKLDQRFVKKITSCIDCMAVISASVHMAQLTGKSLIAEGVSRPEQLRIWARMGGIRAQGYLFAPPLPLSALLTWKDYLTVPVINQKAPVSGRHLALLMLENGDYHQQKRIPLAQCPVSQWLEREASSLAADHDYQTLCRLHPLIHFGGVTSEQEFQSVTRELRAAAEGLLSRLKNNN